ncbi:Sec34-domain-containing protein [Obba rivulosa]|uniref:Conserved oligomeric Golgi complex subunit 3 n=1 Tax=Obba rivulosa TaxID=1052685 RepID=A0A8E2B1D5_9APHY|nr:Sec34-domain-containing protein [Obba rivulosa]
MASAAKRPPAPAPSPTPKRAITMEEWEAKAPLGEIEVRSVNLLRTASEQRPLPLKFDRDESTPSTRPSTPALRNRLHQGSRSSTPIPAARSQTMHALYPTQPIQTPQQFYDWFALIDRSVAHSQEAHFRSHLNNVSEHLEACDRIIQRIDEVDTEVEGMLQGWRSVEEGGKNLKEACEQLLDERDRLIALTEAIDMRLEYFQELEPATRMLNHPGESLVLQTDFLYMVERVDICIDYLKSHRHFREAEIYLLRFQQCMTRAMTLIKMYFVGSLRALTTDVSRRLSERDVSATAQMHLLYTRFRSVSAQLAPLLAELERRAAAHPEELSALLTECHSAYFSARKSLLVNRIIEEIKGLDPTRTELVELTRAGCSYLKQLCMDEFDLYRSFFNSGEDQLYQYLENLCDYLYDDLRPRILHEQRISALCEVCTVLQALMVLDIPALPDSSDDEEDEPPDELNLDLDNGNGVRHGRGLRMLHISHLLQMVLQDAQTRLFFKAQSLIQSDIKYYVPKSEDLAYPEILIAARQPTTGLEIKEKDSGRQLFQLKSLDKQETWYPTLRKTVWVLSQLHDFVKPAIFDDIAQEAVALCLQSLVSAAETLKSTKPPSSVTDGQLFLVRHLVILKELTQSLDLERKTTDRSLGLSGVSETLSSMLNKTSSLIPSALFASFGMPWDENLSDIRQSIDQALKRACEDVISSCVEPLVAPLRSWAESIRVSRALSKQSSPSLPNSAAGQPQLEITTLLNAFRDACERILRQRVVRMRLYLEDARTVGVLLGHVQERVLDEYVEFRVLAREVQPDQVGQLTTEEDVRALLRSACEEGKDSDSEALDSAGTASAGTVGASA